MQNKSPSGVLYVVATPIGNLEDITLRAIRVLRECDLIACEDTRQTSKLLQHYQIHKALVSYHEHNEQARSEELLRQLAEGRNIALVSDAGTPLIADPGYRLVSKARAQGVMVSPIPGASAILCALSASGLPTDAFAFRGFLPPKSGARRNRLLALKDAETTLVFYEAPHRILETLDDIAAVFGMRPVVIGRELTKLHEEFLSGDAAALATTLRSRPSLKGEFTLLIGKADELPPSDKPLVEEVEELIRAGMSRMDALKQVARARGLSKHEAYKLFEKPGD